MHQNDGVSKWRKEKQLLLGRSPTYLCLRVSFSSSFQGSLRWGFLYDNQWLLFIHQLSLRFFWCQNLRFYLDFCEDFYIFLFLDFFHLNLRGKSV